MVCYLITRDSSTPESIVTAIGYSPRGLEKLVAGDLNIDLESLDGNEHDKAIVSAMVMEGIEDMTE